MLHSILLSEDDVKKRSLLYRAQHDPPPPPPLAAPAAPHTLLKEGDKTMSIRLGNGNSNGTMKSVTLSLDIAHPGYPADEDIDMADVAEDKDKALIYTRTHIHTNTDQQQYSTVYDEQDGHVTMDIDTHHHHHPLPTYNASVGGGGGGGERGVVKLTTDIEDIMDF